MMDNRHRTELGPACAGLGVLALLAGATPAQTPDLEIELQYVSDRTDVQGSTGLVEAHSGILRYVADAAAAGFYVRPVVHLGLEDWSNYAFHPDREHGIGHYLFLMDPNNSVDLTSVYAGPAEVAPEAEDVWWIPEYTDAIDDAVGSPLDAQEVHQSFQPILGAAAGSTVTSHFRGYYHRWDDGAQPNEAWEWWSQCIHTYGDDAEYQIHFESLAQLAYEQQAAAAGIVLDDRYQLGGDYIGMFEEGGGIRLSIQLVLVRGSEFSNYDSNGENGFRTYTSDVDGVSLPGLQESTGGDPPVKSSSKRIIVKIPRVDPDPPDYSGDVNNMVIIPTLEEGDTFEFEAYGNAGVVEVRLKDGFGTAQWVEATPVHSQTSVGSRSLFSITVPAGFNSGQGTVFICKIRNVFGITPYMPRGSNGTWGQFYVTNASL